jgi:hypothetical protein
MLLSTNKRRIKDSMGDNADKMSTLKLGMANKHICAYGHILLKTVETFIPEENDFRGVICS